MQYNKRFGDPEVAFGINVLNSLIDNAETMDDLKSAKAYVLSYFMLCAKPSGVYMWCPDRNTFDHYTMQESTMLIRPTKNIFYIPSENPQEPPKKQIFDLRQWFFIENTLVCLPACDPALPRLYAKKGQKYLNIFPGFLHKPQSLSEFSAKVQDFSLCILETSGAQETGN